MQDGFVKVCQGSPNIPMDMTEFPQGRCRVTGPADTGKYLKSLMKVEIQLRRVKLSEGSKVVKACVGEGVELQGLPNTVVRGSLMTPQRVGFGQK